MPNIGKPSPNCHLCRQRRVKCDLARPQCQRCVKYGVQCPGYRDDDELRFRHTDSATFGDRRRRKQQQTHPVSSPPALEAVAFASGSPASPASSQQSDASRYQSAGTPPLPLLRSVHQHWTAEAIPLVISFYPSLDFLPGMFSRVQPDHCLALAGQVFARAYMINRFKSKTDYRELSKLLGSALASVQEAIMSTKAHKSDSTITAVWMLGNYEARFAPESPWHIHGQGILSLLRARGDRQLYTPRGRQIFWLMHNMLQIQYTLTNTPCPPEFDHWLNILEQTMHPLEAFLLRIGRSISSTCSLLSRLIPLVRSGDTQRAVAAYEPLLSEFNHAELTMSEWMQAALQHPYFWNSWRSAQIKVHHMMILLANLVEHAPDCPFSHEALQSRRELCLQVIAASSRDIFNTIPTSLDCKAPRADSTSLAAYHDAVRLIWPLTHVYIFPTTPTHLRVAAREVLLRIGTEQGIMAALEPRPGLAKFFPSEALKGIPVDDMDNSEGYLPCIVTKAGPNGRMP
ncbi:uncharacterized protein LY79DRAFT_519565 [Colletotrichum navitas]|uniref:Zn(2)-C6 fungal-type domain-containing protein n=1 Tax=Colletotrichum navitas TaxID=681940 RepID=A0AAD8PUU1_9PEZI|nr:uncharacterized protein LY79DRAFT_519565 [Colletotrichum navitas]KAK1585094.1 hypothetical protein LY79DRAFT_519565 [Colletotrichum navitas]